MDDRAPEDARASRDRPEAGQALSAVSCFWCERRHAGQHPLSVCPTCTARYSTMRALEMRGAYPLSHEAIDRELTRTSPGNYALGYVDDDTFHVFYVGRSDSDLRERLREWVGVPSRSERYGSSRNASWSLRPAACMPLERPALGRVSNVAGSGYTHFAYSYARSADAAFAQEWRNYDLFGGSQLDNEAHPRGPQTREAGRAPHRPKARPDEAA